MSTEATTPGAVPLDGAVRPLRWLCQSCDWIGNDEDLLRAQSPFDPADTICGCPKCKAVEDIISACDEPGCRRESSCGWPDEAGVYRRTCYEHSKWAKRPNVGVEPHSAAGKDLE